MTRASTDRSGLLRVSVVSGVRRVDLVLPGMVPVAELVPELARSVGVLDPAGAHAGYRLTAADGRRLTGDAGLAHQGVEDGALLTVAAASADGETHRDDDPVETMAEVVETHLAPWGPTDARWTALGVSGLLLVLGAAALLAQGGSVLAGMSAAGVALVLVAGAAVLSRARRDPATAVAAAWAATAYAAVAGVVLAGGGLALAGRPIAAAGAGAVVGGLLCLVGLGPGRVLAIPSVVAGAVVLAAGLVARSADVEPAVIASVALVLVVLAGGALPSLALGAAGAAPDCLDVDPTVDPTVDPAADPADASRPVDRDAVAADARVAHQILVALSGAVGLVLVLAAPLVATLGPAGAVVAVLCCVVVTLRACRHRTRATVLAGLLSGVAGLVAVAAVVLRQHPDWRPVTAVLLVVAGAVLLAATSSSSGPSPRRAWLGDLLQAVALLAVLPLLVVATGLFAAIRS